jgi:UDP-N-acetylmuramoyl-L-alanyl-D-glutamate--2,6-diaminopimelate ligase
MTTNELCECLRVCGWKPAEGLFLPELSVLSVTEDSRRVRPGALFIATPGEHADGHDFAERAASAGAVAVVGNREGITEWAGLPYFFVSEPRPVAGLVAHALAGYPSRFLTVIGVTGTNGKSSIVYITQAILHAANDPTAKFGTLGYEIAGENLPAPHTTPFGEDLADIFAKAKAAGMTHIAMEVSSHALDQERVAGVEFDVAAFTNLTQDHLDFHHDMDNYRRAKLKLFERVEGPGRFTVVNVDDPSAQYFIDASRVPCHTYGQKGASCAESIITDIEGTRFTLITPWGETAVEMGLIGKHNVSNVLCAATIAGGMGVPLDKIAEGLKTLPRVPGRFEPVKAGQDFFVVVDYAHTDDGLRNVLEVAHGICVGRIITVFGCGGDRDKTKRPKMGAVAARLSDFSIVTSDNPRTESPHRILLDIEVGLQREGKRKGDEYIVIESREEAIRHAIGLARKGDFVMIAGKGHEDYQIIGTERIHFDDREVARAVLEGR